jgi:hypothetical protein
MKKRRFIVSTLRDDLSVELRLSYGRSQQSDCVGLVFDKNTIVAGFWRSSSMVGEFDPYDAALKPDKVKSVYQQVWDYLALKYLEQDRRKP